MNIIQHFNSFLDYLSKRYYGEKLNRLALFSIMGISMTAHIILALQVPGYFKSPPFVLAYTVNILVAIIYIKTRSSTYCFQIFRNMGKYFGVPILTIFSDKVAFPFLFGLFIFNQTFFTRKKISRIHMFISFFAIPLKISQVMMSDNIEEIKNMVNTDYKMLQYSAFFVFTISTIINHFQQSSFEVKDEIIREQEVKKRLESQETIVLKFSHELNNPIHVIISNLKELKSLIQSSQKQAHNLLSQAICSSNLLHCFVSNILDTNKIETNAVDIENLPIKFSTFIEELWSNCKTLIESKSLRPKLKIIENDYFNENLVSKTYQFDTQRVKQIVLNIVNNSVKHTNSGKVKMIASVHKSFEKLLLEPMIEYKTISTLGSIGDLGSEILKSSDEESISQNWMRIEIVDTGCGIERSRIKEIFANQSEKITNVQNDSSKELKFGLSLWISIKIVKALGGKITMQSSPTLGTSVIFVIPMIIQDLCKTQVFHKLNHIMNRKDRLMPNQRILKKKVLIVEDVPFNVKIIKSYLEKLSFDIIGVCQNGQEAVDFCQNYLVENRKTINLICMDIEMPVMNGKEASKKIRELETSNNLEPTKLLFVSGNTIKREIDKCLDKDGDIRGDGFLRKPMTQEELNEIIQQILK